MDFIEYKGYRINACPKQLVKSEEWTVSIVIETHHGNHVNTRNFSASNTFATREEGIKHCFEFGRRIIDNKIKLTVVNL